MKVVFNTTLLPTLQKLLWQPIPSNQQPQLRVDAIIYTHFSPHRFVVCLLSLLAFAVPTAVANDFKFLSKSQEGWYWKKIEPLPEEVEEEPPAPLLPGTGAGPGPEPLSSEWLKQNMTTYLWRAMDNPTLENVMAHKYLTRVALDKSSRYAQMSRLATYMDPLLDENTRRPISTFAVNAQNKLRSDNATTALKKIAEKSGIFYFYRSDCPYCKMQEPILATLKRLYNFTILPISLDGGAPPTEHFEHFKVDQGQATLWGVQGTPSMFLVGRNQEKQLIGQGAIDFSQMNRRIISAAYTINFITEAEFNNAQDVPNNVLFPATTEPPPADIDDDPEKLIEYIRGSLLSQQATPLGRP